MFSRALRGALSRSRWASALIQRNGPLARPTSPSATALAENSSKIGTGSGLDHSPSVHALYQPTEPELARRTKAIQLRMWTRAVAPGALKPIRRLLPSGRVTSIPPHSNRRSICSSTRSNAGEIHRASRPPPVAKRRSARTRCSPRVLMRAEVCTARLVVEPDEEPRARCSAGLEKALVGQVCAAALFIDHRHPRPEQEGADALVAFSRGGKARVVEVEGHDPRAQASVVQAVKWVVGPASADFVAAPDHLALPERQRPPARLDVARLSDALDQGRGDCTRSNADRGIDADVTEERGKRPQSGAAPVAPKPLGPPRIFEAQDQRDPDPWVEDEQDIAVEPPVRERLEQPGAVAGGIIEQIVTEDPDESEQKQREKLRRPFLAR